MEGSREPRSSWLGTHRTVNGPDGLYPDFALGSRMPWRQRGCRLRKAVVVQSARVPASRVLLVASFGAFLAFLDATIVNVAFPSIRESFPGDHRSGPVVGAERLQHRASRRS